MGRTKNIEKKNNKRGITWKRHNGGTIILAGNTSSLPVHIPIKFYEDIPNDYRVMGCTRMKITQSNQRTITLK